MVCAPVRSIIPSLKLGDYLSVQAHKPCSISHLTVLISSKISNYIENKLYLRFFRKVHIPPQVANTKILLNEASNMATSVKRPFADRAFVSSNRYPINFHHFMKL